MIYLDHSATSFPKPLAVRQAADRAMAACANPGRGGHRPSMEAAQVVFGARQTAASLFRCTEEQVVFTPGCTFGLNTAIQTLVPRGSRVVITGFEHNAVVRPLHRLKVRVEVAGQKLFDKEDTLARWEDAVKKRPDAAVFTMVSNVFGYMLPVTEMAEICRRCGVPFVIDAAQGAGTAELDFTQLGADFVAIPGHKGLLGPMGVGILLCGCLPEPLVSGGTGSESANADMPAFLPDRAEAGTVNVSGIAGLDAGMQLVQRMGPANILEHEQRLARRAAAGLEKAGLQVFSGPDQAGVVSFLPEGDCQTAADRLAQMGIALRAGLHCAPLAHKSAGTLESGTLRLSCGPGTGIREIDTFLQAVRALSGGRN